MRIAAIAIISVLTIADRVIAYAGTSAKFLVSCANSRVQNINMYART